MRCWDNYFRDAFSNCWFVLLFVDLFLDFLRQWHIREMARSQLIARSPCLPSGGLHLEETETHQDHRAASAAKDQVEEKEEVLQDPPTQAEEEDRNIAKQDQLPSARKQEFARGQD